MTVNTGYFSLEIGKKLKINANTASDLDTLSYAKAIQLLRNGFVNVVANYSDLPTVTISKLGQLYFVIAEERIYYAKSVSIGWALLFQSSINTILTWGKNNYGQLGNGTTTDRSSPGTTIGCGITWCQISSRKFHSSAVKTDGTLWTWGRNNYGQLGDGTTTDRSSPGTTAGGGTTWCQVSSGINYLAAIKTNGTLWTWGRNNYGQLGDGTTTDRSSPGTTAGGGITWCQVSVDYGGISSAVKTDGTLWTWGRNNYGQLGDGTTTDRSSPGTTAGGGTTWCQVSVAGGSDRAMSSAVKTDGTLWTWGRNSSGQLGTGNGIDRSSPGTTAGGGTTWCSVSSGGNMFGHSVSAIKTDGTLWTWGRNNYGQLGDQTTTDRSSPGTTTGGGTTWCQVSVGFCHMIGLKTI